MSVGSVVHCDHCSVYIQIEPSESTPLLYPKSYGKNDERKSSSLCGIIKMVSFSMLIFGGTGVASYLLMKENKLAMSDFSLDFVTMDAWRKNMNPFKGAHLNHQNVVNVVIMQTGGDLCVYLEQCIDHLRTMQKTDNFELPYNFLIGGDGQAFEIRGWDYENGLNYLPRESVIVIGFVGNYNIISPTEKQFKSAYSLIEEMRRRQKLQNSFNIFGIQNLTNSEIEGNQIIKEISKWKGFNTTLKML